MLTKEIEADALPVIGRAAKIQDPTAAVEQQAPEGNGTLGPEFRGQCCGICRIVKAHLHPGVSLSLSHPGTLAPLRLDQLGGQQQNVNILYASRPNLALKSPAGAGAAALMRMDRNYRSRLC